MKPWQLAAVLIRVLALLVGVAFLGVALDDVVRRRVYGWEIPLREVARMVLPGLVALAVCWKAPGMARWLCKGIGE